MISAWSGFFQGELGTAATLAGLLFVSVSVNQVRILALGRMADRGLEALTILLLVVMVASVPLVPGQPVRLLGGEILILGAIALLITVILQRTYMPLVEQPYRRGSMNMVFTSWAAVTLIALAGAVMLWRGDEVGLYLLPVGILVSFVAAGINAWVLLVEINR